MPEEEVLMKGTFDRIGLEGSNYSIRINNEKIVKDVEIKNHEEAVKILLNELIEQGIVNNLDVIEAIGHRIVHGGNKYSKSVVIDDRVIQEIESISDLAPLHNPANLMGVKVFKNAIPSAIPVACFDTAFHQTMKEKTYLYPVPYEWYVKYHVRKYGFHGLSHRFITEKMKKILNEENPNLIICHIGNVITQCIDIYGIITHQLRLQIGVVVISLNAFNVNLNIWVFFRIFFCCSL